VIQTADVSTTHFSRPTRSRAKRTTTMADAAEEEDPPGYVEAEVREFFDKFDSDGSGNVNPDEFRELCEELQPGMEDEAKEEALQELDGTGTAR
jgi:Ca2+-binding EF-hand superfamily protein